MGTQNLELLKELSSGVTLATLSKIFETSPAETARRMRDMSPMGDRAGKPIYNFTQACRYMCDPIVDIDEYIQTLTPADLPVRLQAAYWQSMQRRQDWEEKAGKLWSSDKIKAIFTDVAKKFRQTVLLFADTVDNSIGTTPEQNRMIVKMSHTLINDVREGLLDDLQVSGVLNERARYEQEEKEKEIEAQKNRDKAVIEVVDDSDPNFDDGLGDGLDDGLN